MPCMAPGVARKPDFSLRFTLKHLTRPVFPRYRLPGEDGDPGISGPTVMAARSVQRLAYLLVPSCLIYILSTRIRLAMRLQM